MAKRGGQLPGRLRVVQARRDKGEVTGYWIAVPKELGDDLGYVPGVVVEFVRKGGEIELVRRGEEGG